MDKIIVGGNPEMKNYEVGYSGEFLGVYYARSSDDAIRMCKEDIRDASPEFRRELFKTYKGILEAYEVPRKNEG